MRAFITGIGGFVGRHLARHLLVCGDQVAGSARSPSGVSAASTDVDDAGLWDTIAWDLSSDPSQVFSPDSIASSDGAVATYLARFAPEVIYHLAAYSAPSAGATPAEEAAVWAVNVAGTRRVAELAARCSSRPRLVFVSTSHVYASPPADAAIVDEDASLGPSNPYGRSKLAAEQEVRRAVADDGLDAVIVRAFKHVGPGQSAEFMLPQWARQFASSGDEPVQVWNLDSWFDVTDVRDVVRAYRLVARQAPSGSVLNLGSGVARRSGDLFEVLRRAADSTRACVETRPGRKQEAIADIRRLTALCGWRPEIPLEQTVAEVWSEWRARGRQKIQAS